MERIKYKCGLKYQLAEDYRVQTPIIPEAACGNEYFALLRTGELIIRKGYAWDGASGPTFDTKSSMRPSLIHDVFCQMMQKRMLDWGRWHQEVNEYFRDLCVEDGMASFRASLWYAAVEFANAGHPDQWESNPVQEAP